MPSLVPRLKLRFYVLRVFLPSEHLTIALALFLAAIGGGTIGYNALTDLGLFDA